jgi:hypothetical protein
MASPPLTTREYAYFHVTGNGRHEDVTALLGLSPSNAWNIGDHSPRTGSTHKFMSWKLKSGHDDTEPLAEHVKSLLLLLSLRPDALDKLSSDFDLTLQCVGYFPPSGHGFSFDREQIRNAARLGLAIDLDFYFTEDFGHEL